MNRLRQSYIRMVVLLHLLVWCGGICPLFAQTVEERTDTLTQEPRRARKTATGRVKERVIPPVAPSTDEQKNDTIKGGAVVTDSLKLDNSLPDSTVVVVDTVAIKQLADSLVEVSWYKKATSFKPDPIRAMWLGLAFPGAGQIYNRKYWKLPIVYGGFLGCTYALTWNNQMLSDYQQAYLDIMDSDPTTNSYMKMLPMGYKIEGKEARFKEIFKNKKNYYRKYRDMSIMAFAIVYVVSVIDAYVDAELSTFDISTDLSFQWQPTFIETDFSGPHNSRRIPAMTCALVF